MQQQHTAAPKPSPAVARIRPRQGVVVLSGYGVSISVERGHLALRDGWPWERREGSLGRATSGLRRLVMLGHEGSVTLAAFRWLHDVGAAYVHIDRDGALLGVMAPSGLNDARLRRAQALAASNGVGLAIAKELVRRKISGQLGVATELQPPDGSLAALGAALASLDSVKSPAELRIIEAQAAGAYWDAWESLPVRFAKRDQDRVPEHWLTFGTRKSPLSHDARLAANPANALLNYGYALLEAECRIALLTLGLDPGLGVLHADQDARDSLALDLMEPLRPEVDRHVLSLLRERTFAAREFHETPNGICRLVPPLPQKLAEGLLHWRRLVAPLAEEVADRLAQNASSRAMRAIPTILTESRRSAARASRRARATVRREGGPTLQRLCVFCGEPVQGAGRYCQECSRDQQRGLAAALTVAGPAALARLRANGADPAHGGEAGKARGATLTQRRRDAKAWQLAHGDAERPNPEVFTKEILPTLQSIPLRTLVRATGLSLRYCSLVRQGQAVPHPRHWDALRAVAEGAG